MKRKILKIASDKCGLDEELLDIVDTKIIEKGIKRRAVYFGRDCIRGIL